MTEDRKPQQIDPEHELPAIGDDEVVFLEADEGPPAFQAQDPAPPPAREAVLPADAQKLKAERDELFDKLARLQAEFDNFRKRQAREQQEFRSYALADALTLLLPVLDSFDRAVATRTADEAGLRSGVELMHRQLHDTLGRLGLEPVEAQGKPFDPNLHEAVEVRETDEGEDGLVLEELQRGYRLRDRLLRPAMVRVARRRSQ
jgi:molecular chaperone GrpE